ncbi:MAG: hypothetical protein ABI233_00785 [Chthoniobacterales bacterium]
MCEVMVRRLQHAREKLAAEKNPAPRHQSNRFRDEVFILRRGQRYGPYSKEELSQELDAGTFALGDSASTDNGNSWVAVRILPGVAVKPFTVQRNAQAHWLVIRYRGRVGPAEVEQCAEEVQLALQKLPEGFQLLVDLTDLEVMDMSCAHQIKRIMKLCNAAGVTAVARIIPDQKTRYRPANHVLLSLRP